MARVVNLREAERGYRVPDRKEDVGSYASWEVYKNDYIVQDHVEAMIKLCQNGFSLLAGAMYAAMARRFQLSIWNPHKFQIKKRHSPLFDGDRFIIYPEWELVRDFEYAEPSIRRAFKELSDAGYVLRFQSGGSGSKVPSKIIVFQLDRPFQDFKRKVRITSVKGRVKTVVSDYWKQVQEKMIEDTRKDPAIIFDEIIEALPLEKYRRVRRPGMDAGEIEKMVKRKFQNMREGRERMGYNL